MREEMNYRGRGIWADIYLHLRPCPSVTLQDAPLTPSRSQTQHRHKAYSTYSVWMSGWPFHRRDFPAPSSTRGHRMVGHLVDSPVDSALFNIDRCGVVDH